MTTKTDAKRTGGELQIMNLFELYTIGGTEKRIGIVNQRRIGNEEAQANAEFIRKAWNLHDELVAEIETLRDAFDGMISEARIPDGWDDFVMHHFGRCCDLAPLAETQDT